MLDQRHSTEAELTHMLNKCKANQESSGVKPFADS